MHLKETRKYRFFTDKHLKIGKRCTLSGPDTHHIKNVLRLQKGEEISLIDPEGKEFLCIIEELSRKEITVYVSRGIERKTESRLEIALAVSLINTQKMDDLIRHTTELGVSRIIPVESARSQVKTCHIQGRTQRWQEIVKSACQQCGRTRMAKIENTVPFETLLDNFSFPLKIISWEKECLTGLREIHNAHSGVDKILVAVGPEGGFTPEEVEKAKQNDFVPFSLGPRILRTETAARPWI